jgi:hypothetical protein
MHMPHIPDSKLAQEITGFIRDQETELLFHHSSRVFCFGALAGERDGLRFDPELLYAGAMFHDLGLMPAHASQDRRFEVDGAEAARVFLAERGIPAEAVRKVWLGIALHTTPGVPEHLEPEVALVTAGVEMDVLGLTFDRFSDAQREAVVQRFPRPAHFKEEILQAFYDGIRHKPATTFGNVKADVLADKDPAFRPLNFCQIIRSSRWPG